LFCKGTACSRVYTARSGAVVSCSYETASRPASPGSAAPHASATAARPVAAPPPPPEPPPVSPEDDIPEDDDPDLDESALSGHDLIVRELGATVVEEITNE
ncbi:DNA polymerase III subunit gamma and tau, partial [Streptomyces scabiei]|nr:DNA polymerase III subunit gamma and tau [Streptomyces scabiei]